MAEMLLVCGPHFAQQNCDLLKNTQPQPTFTFFLFTNLFFYLLFIFGYIGSSLLHAAFSSCGERGLLLVALRGLLIAVASLVAELRL